jgi:hypothetical protein
MYVLQRRDDDVTNSPQGAAPVMRTAGGRRWFLAGNDYCWPHSVHRAARPVLPRYGAVQTTGRRPVPRRSKPPPSPRPDCPMHDHDSRARERGRPRTR